MKSLRRLVFVNALLLAAAGGTIAFNPPLSLPVRYGLGWVLTLIALAMAAALAWMVRRPLWSAESGIAALSIPDGIRQDLLRQIGEAAAQEERNRLARDLHDSIKQQLFSINVGTAAAQERWERDPEGARKALADVRRSAREAMVEMQAMLHQLRPEPLGTAGLVEALREQCEALGYRTGAEVTLELGEPLPDDRMPPGAPEALFRMAQEMMANVARHARARNVRLWLGRQDEEVILRIEDDGQGFEPAVETSGMGLRNLRERAAALRGAVEIASTPGTGARVTVHVPLIPPDDSDKPVDLTRVGLWEVACYLGWWATIFLTQHLRGILLRQPYVFLVVALILALPLYVTWNRLHSQRGKGIEPRVKEYIRCQQWLLHAPMLGWVFASTDRSWLISGIIMGGTLVQGAVAWVSLHRMSEVRRFWRQGSRSWLVLAVLAEAGIVLALGSVFFAPGPLVPNLLEALFLLMLGIAVVYVASRQMRLEGARP